MTTPTTSEPRPRMRNGELLRRVFLHQNGFAALTALATLEASGALGRRRKEGVPATELVSASRAPWAVAASIVAACGAGWLTMRTDDADGCVVSPAASPDLDHVTDILLDTHRAVRERVRGGDWSQESVVARVLGCLDILAAAKASLRRRTSAPEATTELIIRLLEGVVAVPLLPRVASGYDYPTLAPLFAALELEETAAVMRRVLPFFAPMYGLAGSYAQALMELPDRVAADDPPTPSEINRSIDRGLNVRASAAAHRAYFQVATRMVARLFDGLPLPQQPRAILDVGCGDGTWLRGLYEAITRSTERGRSLRRHPLHLVGVDLDPVALDISRRNLRDLPATCIRGDVGDAAAIAQAAASATGIDSDDVLSVRAFVDHNRALPAGDPGRPSAAHLTSGVYATASGSVVGADTVHRDWGAHYARWRKTCGRHGLVVIEAHTVDIAQVNARLEKGHALALQYYHALSGQSPVPHASFLAAARSAGLEAGSRLLFPDRAPTTSISWLRPSADAGAG
jgi:SAM-dependent methyltransferase